MDEEFGNPDRMDSEEGGQVENPCPDRGMDSVEGGEVENPCTERMDSVEGGEVENPCTERMDSVERGEVQNPCSPENLLSQLFLSEPVTTEETERLEHDDHCDIDDLLDSGSEKENERETDRAGESVAASTTLAAELAPSSHTSRQSQESVETSTGKLSSGIVFWARFLFTLL